MLLILFSGHELFYAWSEIPRPKNKANRGYTLEHTLIADTKNNTARATNKMLLAGVLLLESQGLIFNSDKIAYSVTGGYQHSRGGIVHLPMQFTSPIVTLKTKQGWWASPSDFSITYTGRLPVLVPCSCRICIGVFPGLLLWISCVFKLYQRSIHKQLRERWTAIYWLWCLQL